MRCEVREDLDIGSDHYPIATRLLLNTTRLESVPRRRWNGMDVDAIWAGAQHLAIPESLRTADEIDRYTQYIIEFTQGLIEHTVPWAKPSSHGQPWWTEDIRIAVWEERTTRKQWRISGNAADWDDKIQAGRAKVRMIREAKRKCFREKVHEAAQGEGIWKLAKWGRTSNGPAALPVMPPLVIAGGTACTLEEKVEALRQRFYPTVEADLSDIADTSFADSSFHNPLEIQKKVDPQEIASLLRSRRSHRAPGSDLIPNEFLKAMGGPLTVAVAALAIACWKAGHYPKQLKHARTVALRKPSKEAYDTPGAWRPIALLNTVGKLIEGITAKRIQEAAEEHHLLPASQMGVRKGRSTDTALELLVEQVQTVWTSKQRGPKYHDSVSIPGIAEIRRF